MEETKSVVETLIDRMVEGDLDAAQAVSSLLDGRQELPESVEMSIEEGEGLPDCPACGEKGLTEAQLESEDETIPLLHCSVCDTGFVPDVEDSSVAESEADGDVSGIKEAEIDEDDPKCPACGSDDLHGSMEKHEGQEIPVITCKGCKATMVPADEE